MVMSIRLAILKFTIEFEKRVTRSDFVEDTDIRDEKTDVTRNNGLVECVGIECA